MGTAVLVIVTISTTITVARVLSLFVWAARKDGEFDRSAQKRTGINAGSRRGAATPHRRAPPAALLRVERFGYPSDRLPNPGLGFYISVRVPLKPLPGMSADQSRVR